MTEEEMDPRELPARRKKSQIGYPPKTAGKTKF
jgi:hypothetical protein